MSDKSTTSLADLVFERIEASILDGTYPEGTILTETKLSTSLGVSRTPVREAIRRLEQEGLITVSGKGIVIRGFTMQDFLDVYEIRLRIEGLATRWCAERISEEQLKKLIECFELFRYYTQRDIPEQIKDADTQFHELIYEYCGSPTLKEILSALHKRVARFRRLSVQDHERARIASSEHEGILHALCSHDAELAEQLAIAHILAARNSIAKRDLSKDS